MDQIQATWLPAHITFLLARSSIVSMGDSYLQNGGDISHYGDCASSVSLLGRDPLLFNMRTQITAQWPSGPKRESVVNYLLELRVRIPPEVWISVCCECCVLSGTCLCDGRISHRKESFRMWWVILCGIEALKMRRPWPDLGCCSRGNRKNRSNWKNN